MNNTFYKITIGKVQFEVEENELLLFFLMKESIYSLGKAQGRNRGGFCGMGVCHECLIELKGGKTVLACQTLVNKNMVINHDE